MTDAETLRAFIACEQRWLAVLAATRKLHSETLGKRLTNVHWLPEVNRGSCGWLGFYWESPPFWFGFGLRGDLWLPLIECDVRRCDPNFVVQLAAELPAAWRRIDRLTGRYWRLWAPASQSGRPRAQVTWLAKRSRELHEFTVTD